METKNKTNNPITFLKLNISWEILYVESNARIIQRNHIGDLGINYGFKIKWGNGWGGAEFWKKTLKQNAININLDLSFIWHNWPLLP